LGEQLVSLFAQLCNWLVSVVKMVTVLEDYSAKEQPSFMRFL
jgi:hypothetical protein